MIEGLRVTITGLELLGATLLQIIGPRSVPRPRLGGRASRLPRTTCGGGLPCSCPDTPRRSWD